MSDHAHNTLGDQQTQPMGEFANKWAMRLLAIGVVALVGGLVSAMALPGENSGLDRFGFSYLTGFAYALSITLGSLLLMLLTHLFRAGWVVVVRRVLECQAAAVVVLAVLFIPILIYVFVGTNSPYPWSQATEKGSHAAAVAEATIIPVSDNPHETTPSHETPASDHGNASEAHSGSGGHETKTEIAATHGNYGDPEASKKASESYMIKQKSPWLNPSFFTLRWAIYFVVWSVLAHFYLRSSVKQDGTKDIALTTKRETFAPISTILTAYTLTYASFDLLMSLDPTWYSTMYGVYFFTGSMIAAIATTILVVMVLEKAKVLTCVTIEHYHDLGKLLFAFIIFWAYIGFSQYMLIWYATLPGEQPWAIIRGMSGVHETPYQYVAIFMVLFHFGVPFLFMMSRHVKRCKMTLAIAAIWMLFVHGVDLFWLVLPEFRYDVIVNPLPEILCIVGMTAMLLGTAALIARKVVPVALGDPRLEESLAFRNF